MSQRKLFWTAFCGALLGALVSPIALEAVDELNYLRTRHREAR